MSSFDMNRKEMDDHSLLLGPALSSFSTPIDPENPRLFRPGSSILTFKEFIQNSST
jgi:hypothetical protein